ncbi:MAG TPA: hypothetical protein VIK52_00170 [Opitutaceae bacterium]
MVDREEELHALRQRVIDACAATFREAVLSAMAKFAGQDYGIFLQGMVTCLLCEAGFALSEVVGHAGATPEQIDRSLRRSLVQGLVAARDAHAKDCEAPGRCGYLGRVDPLILLYTETKGAA